MSEHRTLRWRPLAVLALAAAVVPSLAACGSSSSGTTAGSASSTTRSGTLTIGAGATPNLDPTQVAPPYFWPVYDTPIYQRADGSYAPDLATDWGYASADNKSFKFTLRSGMTFSDGKAVTAEAAAASMKRFLVSGGPVAVSAGPVADVTADGADTVVISYKQAVPLTFAINSLTQNHSFGALIGPDGLADPDSLGATPDGVGPYTLDTSATTSGSLYTYVPNAAYFNQQAIHYDKVVIRTIADTASLLSSAQAGQIDYDTSVPAASVQAAKSSGLNVVTEDGASFTTFALESQESGPLANQQVRQAIAYALPRTDIIKAALGGLGTAGTSTVAEGLLGYNAANTGMYDYDVEKAKSLLAAAGYGSGFTITALTQPAYSTTAQAVAAALSAVGITLDLTVNSGTFPEFASALQTKKFDTAIASNPALDIFSLVQLTLSPGGTSNAFSLSTDDLNTALATAAALPEDQQAAAFADVTTLLDQKAWPVPVAVSPSVYAISTKVQNVPSSYVPTLFYADPFSPETESGWYGS